MALALNCGIPSTPQGRELVQHGSALFPIACYEERLTCYSVPWHWHEDFEYILAYEGTVTVGVDKKRICLAEGEGVFINSGVLHAVEFAAEGPSMLRSGVFHPRLVGGMDTIYWQKLIRQLLGTTPIQYVKQYRIEKAAGLLLTTRLRTGEIGAECGFTDLSYFTKTFREIKHCTPREYRQRFAVQG